MDDPTPQVGPAPTERDGRDGLYGLTTGLVDAVRAALADLRRRARPHPGRGP